jgi:hypothetical protein
MLTRGHLTQNDGSHAHARPSKSPKRTKPPKAVVPVLHLAEDSECGNASAITMALWFFLSAFWPVGTMGLSPPSLPPLSLCPQGPGLRNSPKTASAVKNRGKQAAAPGRGFHRKNWPGQLMTLFTRGRSSAYCMAT